VLWIPPERRRGGLLAIAVAGALMLAGVLVCGVDNTRGWIAAIAAAPSWTWAIHNGSISAIFAKALYIYPVTIAPDVGHVALPATLASLLVLGVGVIVISRTTSRDRALLVMTLTSLLVSPLGWNYYGWMLLGPLAACWSDRRVRWATILLAPLWAAPF